MANMYVCSPSVGVQSYPLFDASIPADRKVAIILPDGTYKYVAFDRTAINSKRTIGSKFHTYYGGEDYVAALQEYGVYPTGPSSLSGSFNNFSVYTSFGINPGSAITFEETIGVNFEGRSAWTQDTFYTWTYGTYPYGSVSSDYGFSKDDWHTDPNFAGCNLSVRLGIRVNASPSVISVLVDGNAVVARTVSEATNVYSGVCYRARLHGYHTITVRATNIRRYNSNDRFIAINAITTVS